MAALSVTSPHPPDGKSGDDYGVHLVVSESTPDAATTMREKVEEKEEVEKDEEEEEVINLDMEQEDYMTFSLRVLREYPKLGQAVRFVVPNSWDVPVRFPKRPTFFYECLLVLQSVADAADLDTFEQVERRLVRFASTVATQEQLQFVPPNDWECLNVLEYIADITCEEHMAMKLFQYLLSRAVELGFDLNQLNPSSGRTLLDTIACSSYTSHRQQTQRIPLIIQLLKLPGVDANCHKCETNKTILHYANDELFVELFRNYVSIGIDFMAYRDQRGIWEHPRASCHSNKLIEKWRQQWSTIVMPFLYQMMVVHTPLPTELMHCVLDYFEPLSSREQRMDATRASSLDASKLGLGFGFDD